MLIVKGRKSKSDNVYLLVPTFISAVCMALHGDKQSTSHHLDRTRERIKQTKEGEEETQRRTN